MNRWFALGFVGGLGLGVYVVLRDCPWQGCLAPGLYLTPLPQERTWASR